MTCNKEPSRLGRGKAFHKEMQGDWVNSGEERCFLFFLLHTMGERIGASR